MLTLRKCVPVLMLLSVIVGCQLRKPFEATVVAAGASGRNIKHGFFATSHTVAGPNGDVTVEMDIDTALAGNQLGKPFFTVSDPALQAVELAPLQIDDERGPGYVVFDLMNDENRPDAETGLCLLSWVDGDDDDKLDLSSVAESETARTIYRHDVESNEKAVLGFYNYLPNADDPFYTATALTPSIVNVIVTEDFLKDWMAILPSDTDAPPPPPDTDGDGLDDPTETRIGTSIFDGDTDFDAKNDLDEVGADLNAPTDSDGDGVIDALESSINDTDGDGTPDESDAT